MTAYARSEEAGDWGNATWEIKSVNHRYLDLSLRLPDELRILEPPARERIGKQIKRGKVECSLRYEPAPRAAGLQLDRDLARRLIKAAAELEIEAPAAINRLEVLRWPGVLQKPPPDLDTLTKPLLRLLDAALKRLVESRRREGEKISALLEQRCASCAEQVTILQAALPQILAGVKERYLRRASEAGVELDAERLEQEFLLWCQKMDVAEELERLRAHIEETRRTLRQEQPVGRRLDFLMQEMHREANTLGAKSAHLETSNASIELRVLIEQMREQIQNIE